MEKKVFCLIGERCKTIKYTTQNDLTDVQQILCGLKDAAIRDDILQKMLHNKLIVLQRPDIDRGNKLCDIDEDDEIANKSEVTVLLVQVAAAAEPPTCPISSLKSGQTMSLDLNVLYEEANKENFSLSPSKPASVLGDSSLLLTDTKGNNDKIILPMDIDPAYIEDIQGSLCDTGKNDENHSNEIRSVPEIEFCNSRNVPSTSRIQKMPGLISGPGSISFPATLPQLTFDLMEKLKKFSVLDLQKELIFFWGSYLWQMTHGEPNKRDYHNLALSIVAAYPALAGGNNRCGIVKMQLSTWIRNHRANIKKKLGKKNAHGSVKSPTKCAVVGTSGGSEPTENDVENALKELNKKHKDSNRPHVKRLLEITLKQRRTFIEKEATSLSEVISKFPQLKEYEMLIFEFLTLKKVSMEQLVEAINLMIEKLKKFFSVHGNTQESDAQAMTSLYERLTKSKTKKCLIRPLFIVEEMLGSTENLLNENNDSPRIVMYMAEEGVASAFLVADGDIRVKIPEPTVVKSVACLMAAYYAWDTAYPAGYRNVLEYIDNELFGQSTQTIRPVISKFIRERDSGL